MFLVGSKCKYYIQMAGGEFIVDLWTGKAKSILFWVIPLNQCFLMHYKDDSFSMYENKS